MTAAGIVFSNIHDESLPELTRLRTMASVPFGGRYRLIDFALSNMINSGISKVGVITHYNYQSLLDHIGTGKDWDLARRSGGIKILPPFITAYDAKGVGQLYSTRLEALLGVVNFALHRGCYRPLRLRYDLQHRPLRCHRPSRRDGSGLHPCR